MIPGNDQLMMIQLSRNILILLSVENLQIKEKFTWCLTVFESSSNDPNQKEVYKTQHSDQYSTSFAFKKDFYIQHMFEDTQFLTFNLQANGKKFGKISRVKLNDIIRGRVNKQYFTNENSQKVGTLVFNPQIIGIKDEKKSIELQVKAKIQGVNEQNNSQYFYKIIRKQLKPNGQYKDVEVYCSENVKANPSNVIQWPKALVLAAKICHNNYDMKLEVKIYIANFLFHSKVGGSQFTINTILKNQKLDLYFKNTKTANVFIRCKINQKKSYVQHIQDGLQIMSVLCIDFTESNLPPDNPKSKHYTSDTKSSDYQKVFQVAIDPILQIDLDKQIPGFGFGAIVKHPSYDTNGLVSNRFPFSMDENHTHFTNLQELKKHYRQVMKYLKFAGPTYMGPLVKWAVKQCRQFLQSKNSFKYLVLFILTDGQFCDEEVMRDLIVQCSTLPISIVFIGIGDQDFSILEELDDDNCQLKDSKGNPTSRDCVQFVSFEKYKDDIPKFKAQVLAEVPEQIQKYFNDLNGQKIN